MNVHKDHQRKHVDRVLHPGTGWGPGQSQLATAQSVVLTGDAFLALEAGRVAKPGPKSLDERKRRVTLPKIGGKPK